MNSSNHQASGFGDNASVLRAAETVFPSAQGKCLRIDAVIRERKAGATEPQAYRADVHIHDATGILLHSERVTHGYMVGHPAGPYGWWVDTLASIREQRPNLTAT